MGDQSPRRYGRNRTDTMVFSEAFNVAEELSKGSERELDGAQEENSVQSADGTTTQAVLEVPTISEPEIIIDELEASSIEAAVPPTKELDPDSHQDTIESFHPADASETAIGAAESLAHNPISDTSAKGASALEAHAGPASTERTASDTVAEDATTDEAKVEEAQKANPDHVAEEPPSVSHSSESETSDALATEVSASTSPDADAESGEALPVAAGEPEIPPSDTTDQSVADDAIPPYEHEAEPAQAEFAAEGAVEVTAETSSDLEKESEHPS